MNTVTMLKADPRALCLPGQNDLGAALDDANRTMAGALTLIDDLAAERDDALARLQEVEAALASAHRELRALEWCNRARERTIVRQLHELRDRRHRRCAGEAHALTQREAFIALHPIAEVIGQVVELTPRENGHRQDLAGLCPFCDDARSPSLAVYPYHAEWACYQCGAGGTVVEFLAKLRDQRAPRDGGA